MVETIHCIPLRREAPATLAPSVIWITQFDLDQGHKAQLLIYLRSARHEHSTEQTRRTSRARPKHRSADDRKAFWTTARFKERKIMAKYLILASYNADGLKGLQKDKASGRRSETGHALESLGGKTEAFYYAFGRYDVVHIVDLPDNVAASAFSLAVSATGLVRTQTIPLLTVEEADKAIDTIVKYRAPGH